MPEEIIRFGLIGGGLMGKEFASAAGRWMHLQDVNFQPVIVAACARHQNTTDWFKQNVPTIEFLSTDYRDLLANTSLDAIYCAVPHNLHEQFYTDIIKSGKHLLGEKPFGMNKPANRQINKAIAAHPDVFVRVSSQFSYYPGAYRIFEWLTEGRFGQIIEVEVGFLHCSDLNPHKPINWKRKIDINGEYGCMGDLGPHVLHIPLRRGWKPRQVSAILSQIVTERPDEEGNMVPCDTWDNAILSTRVETDNQSFPMTIAAKRIAPGEVNTWYIRIYGTDLSAEYSTKNPRELRYLPYAPGDEQAWRTIDVPYRSAYPANVGSIFEFNMSDAFIQMLAAYCDELVNGEKMSQPFHCITPDEATQIHEIFTAALKSQASMEIITLE